MRCMGEVVELATWRAGNRDARPAWHPSFGGAADRVAPADQGDDDRLAMGRLELAVGRLDHLAGVALRRRGALAPEIETELFAVIGQVQMGMVSEAADRAERLAARIGAVHAGGR